MWEEFQEFAAAAERAGGAPAKLQLYAADEAGGGSWAPAARAQSALQGSGGGGGGGGLGQEAAAAAHGLAPAGSVPLSVSSGAPAVVDKARV